VRLETLGLAFTVVGAGIALISLAAAILRAALVNAHLRRVRTARATRRVTEIAASGRALAEAADRVASIRFDGVAAQAELAVEVGGRFAADIELIARTTEDLLDAFVPSRRGVASDR